MKHSTYRTLYQSFLGAVDEKALLESYRQESDPFYKSLIEYIINRNTFKVSWDNKRFTTEFLSESPRQRLDETFLAFVLRIVDIVKEESYIHIFQNPESHPTILAWISLLRNVLICSLALLYNVEWTAEAIMKYLEPTIINIFTYGDPLAIRQLMTDLGITLAQNELYQAEQMSGRLHFLQTSQFGSFYWRFLHWMAEAVDLRDEKMAFYKNQWRQLIKEPLYRTIKCVSCMNHFKHELKENESQLLDEKGDLPQLFFKIHNRVHAIRRETYSFLQEPDYSDTQYEKDSEFMRQALLAK